MNYFAEAVRTSDKVRTRNKVQRRNMAPTCPRSSHACKQKGRGSQSIAGWVKEVREQGRGRLVPERRRYSCQNPGTRPSPPQSQTHRDLKCVWPRMNASSDLVQGGPKTDPPPQPPVSPA